MTELSFEIPNQSIENPGNWQADVIEREPWHTRFESLSLIHI